MFSLLIAFVRFTNFRDFHHCFFRCFYFTTDFYYCFLGVFIYPTFFTVTVFVTLSGTSFLCCCTASVESFLERASRDLRELLLLSGVFYLTFFSYICTNCFYQGFPGSRKFFYEGFRASHSGSKHRPDQSVCLNHTVFSKWY